MFAYYHSLWPFKGCVTFLHLRFYLRRFSTVLIGNSRRLLTFFYSKRKEFACRKTVKRLSKYSIIWYFADKYTRHLWQLCCYHIKIVTYLTLKAYYMTKIKYFKGLKINVQSQKSCYQLLHLTYKFKLNIRPC